MRGGEREELGADKEVQRETGGGVGGGEATRRRTWQPANPLACSRVEADHHPDRQLHSPPPPHPPPLKQTGTLTQNLMTVVDGYFAGWACEGELPTMAAPSVGVPASSCLSAPALKIISEAVAVNTKAEIGFDAKKGDGAVLCRLVEWM